MCSSNPYRRMMKDMPFAPWQDAEADRLYIQDILSHFENLQTEAMELLIEPHEYEEYASFIYNHNDKTALYTKRFVKALSEPEPRRRFELLDAALQLLMKQFPFPH